MQPVSRIIFREMLALLMSRFSVPVPVGILRYFKTGNVKIFYTGGRSAVNVAIEAPQKYTLGHASSREKILNTYVVFFQRL